jgi:hypothetical protein
MIMFLHLAFRKLNNELNSFTSLLSFTIDSPLGNDGNGSISSSESLNAAFFLSWLSVSLVEFFLCPFDATLCFKSLAILI